MTLKAALPRPPHNPVSDESRRTVSRSLARLPAKTGGRTRERGRGARDADADTDAASLQLQQLLQFVEAGNRTDGQDMPETIFGH